MDEFGVFQKGDARRFGLATGVVFAGICLVLCFLGDATDSMLIAPVLAAEFCAGAVILAVHRTESVSEGRVVRFGLLLVTIFFATNSYEVLLYGLRFCDGEGAAICS